MNQAQWEKMRHEMAIEVIVMDLVDIMFPEQEARQRAQSLLKSTGQEVLNLKYRMGQALLALDKLGYFIGSFTAETTTS